MKLTNSFLKIQEYIESGVFPGLSFMVMNSKGSHKYYFGRQEIKPEIKEIEEGLIYDLASVSKVVGVGTIIIRDILKGRLDLDQKLKYYYPDFHDSSISLRELLTHTSGIDPYIENRDEMTAPQLIDAINNIRVTDNKTVKYTDINFLLLGFMLENFYKKDLDQIIKEEVLEPFGMTETFYGPVKKAVKTSLDIENGQIHDPKARLLAPHAGSAGLFSSLEDLEIFVKNYFYNKEYFSNSVEKLYEDYSENGSMRSIAWDLWSEDWLLHTGYTGTFIMINVKEKKAVVFLSNRVHLKDDREAWIQYRNELIRTIIEEI